MGVVPEKKSLMVDAKGPGIPEYHEADRAILFHVLPDVGPV